MSMHKTDNTPPPTNVTLPNELDSAELNNGESLECNSQRTPPAESHETPDSPSCAVDSDNAQSSHAKHSIYDYAAIIPHVLPENPDWPVQDSSVFHWHITNWKSLESRSHSPAFQVGDFQWRILLFPKGNTHANNSNGRDHTSVYLEVVKPAKEDDTSGTDWYVCARFSLVISNPSDPTSFQHCDAHHRFTAEEVDWGFTRFCDRTTLARGDASSGKGPFLIDNETVLSAYVQIIKDETGVLWHNFINYDSRKETGYVGIKNQGATCYMNSLLQSLYCTNIFRRAVYQIPTASDKPSESVPLALQRCFYNLQFSNTPVGTTELTKSFGWETADSFMQHDVQEFNRVLQDTLELKMKGTPADGAITSLFVGKMKSYIKCIHVPYESSRVEDYYDIQLNVRGCRTLIDSFKDYVTVEKLEGENKYMTEGHGLQDAHKGVIFESFPPVLHLQLKRFEYNFAQGTMVKINDYQEFPEEINLDEFCSVQDANDPNTYVLTGVLVHSGDVHGGHYFALIKPEKDSAWLRFDDDRVTRVTRKQVFEDNFGDPLENHASLASKNAARSNSEKLLKGFTSAYMLVYIRKNKLDHVLGLVQSEDIPSHLKRPPSEERAALEQRRKDREEMHLHVKATVVVDRVIASRRQCDMDLLNDGERIIKMCVSFLFKTLPHFL